MVVKLRFIAYVIGGMFESRVILDGSQTFATGADRIAKFESRVILDGSQTLVLVGALCAEFESRVILDGSQTVCIILTKDT